MTECSCGSDHTHDPVSDEQLEEISANLDRLLGGKRYVLVIEDAKGLVTLGAAESDKEIAGVLYKGLSTLLTQPSDVSLIQMQGSWVEDFASAAPLVERLKQEFAKEETDE